MLSHPPQRDQTHVGLKRLQLQKIDVIRFLGASFWRQIICSLVSWNCLMVLSTLQAYLHCQRSWNKPSASVLHLQTFRIFSPRSWYCGSNMVDWLKSSYRLQKKNPVTPRNTGVPLFEAKVFDRLLVDGPGKDGHEGATERARCAASEVAAQPFFSTDQTNYAWQTLTPAQLKSKRFGKSHSSIQQPHPICMKHINIGTSKRS